MKFGIESQQFECLHNNILQRRKWSEGHTLCVLLRFGIGASAVLQEKVEVRGMFEGKFSRGSSGVSSDLLWVRAISCYGSKKRGVVEEEVVL